MKLREGTVKPAEETVKPDGKNGENGREEQEQEFIESLARKTVDLGLETPAIFFLEFSKPAGFMASQAMIFFGPLVQALVPWKNYQQFVELFERRENVERLIRSIEARKKNRRKAEG